MDNYRITVGVEPTDNYEKAKHDILQAMTSIRNLPPPQQQMLAEELFGATNVSVLQNIFRQVFGKQSLPNQ